MFGKKREFAKHETYLPLNEKNVGPKFSGVEHFSQYAPVSKHLHRFSINGFRSLLTVISTISVILFWHPNQRGMQVHVKSILFSSKSLLSKHIRFLLLFLKKK